MINATKIGVKGAALFVLTFLFSYGAAYAQSNLFFSEYIEGSSNNKAWEIYNPNSTPVNLDNYQIAQSSNGDGWEFYHTFPNGASIPGYGTYVITTDQVSSSLFNADFADEVLGWPSVTHHNGNDARALIHISGTDTTFLDVFGDPNSDADWAVGDSAEATKDHTLVRKPNVSTGNTTALGSFGTDDASSEWIVYPQNDFGGLGAHREYGTPITIRDLNTYQNVPEFSEAAIEDHPLADSTVTLTVVITSYPKSSGLSNPDDTNDDGTIDEISRIHVFVTDTNAASMGRQGMSIQLVESDYSLLDGFTRGDVVTLDAVLGFFGGTSQVAVESVNRLGNVNQEFPEYASLLDPWEVDLTDINSFEDGELSMNFQNYNVYNGAYVKINSATVSNVAQGNRVDWAINKDGSRIYVYDTSLRYRNDHAIGAEGYLPSYNARRIDPNQDGPFEAPASGANVDISGFVNYVGDDPDGLVPSGNGAFSINPFEDGVVWLNGVRNVDGQDGFEWPNDLVVNGLPPVISNVSLSDSTITSSDAVTVTASAEAVDGATLTGVSLIYTSPDTTDTLTMSNTSGNEFSATLPTFDNFTPVSFYIEASDDNGLTGRAPFSGGFSFFVADDPISSISVLQETGDGQPGSSPLLGAGAIPVNITATVVSSAGESGFITIQDAAAAWSGIYVEEDSETESLNIGDEINVTELTISEEFGVTFATLDEFTVASSGNSVASLAVELITQDITGSTTAYEEYEGVYLKFNDVKVTTNQADGSSDFGEWEFGSTQGGGAADTLEAGDGLRVDDAFTINYGSDLNDHVKVGAQMQSLSGVLYYSFGNPKMILRTLDDVVADDWTLPDTGFDLETPADEATVEVTGDITVEWEATSDFDGNDITYEWVLYSADTANVVASVPSNDDSTASAVTLTYETVDGLLASAGLEVGDSEDFVWTVRVSDGVDTVAAAEDYDVETNTFSTLYYSLTLQRAMETSGEVETGLPKSFDLKQNYPNPFNPTTNITFDLPRAADVSLTVYDMLGRKVATLVNERMNAGSHTAAFDASRLASGMYIYRIEAGSFESIKKMMLIK
ncbi:MAG: lamin tail domain-containing protein [Gracilimonas sp.]|uniref:lamin tail domain-containing protein n=1 Tax=Gracilimonas TaxID=649462 RepID=UPI001B237DA7|nr:lamin tail domain-containing protein [Gracilimonas sp.]MBO6584589.1 lamin tail domain-containing protein [Gracilimonas sp.]MBO6616140.1 lamin tail domain-containing protein [Gracilimonas sp.]